VVLAQHPPPCGRSVLLKLAGALEVTQIPEGRGEVVHRGEGVGVVLAQHPSVRGQGLLLQRQGLLVLAPAPQRGG
jgi:hypothetical protein